MFRNRWRAGAQCYFDICFETVNAVLCGLSFTKKIVMVTKHESVLPVLVELHTVFAVGLHSRRTGTPWGHLQRDTLSSSCQPASKDAQKGFMPAPNHIGIIMIQDLKQGSDHTAATSPTASQTLWCDFSLKMTQNLLHFPLPLISIASLVALEGEKGQACPTVTRD